MSIMKGKGSTLMLAAMMMGGAGMVGSGRRYQEPVRRKPCHTPLGNTAVLKEIPKGHKTELFFMAFRIRDEEYHFEVLISYGTAKSKEKRRRAKFREIQEYLIRTPDDLIHSRKEYRMYRKIEKTDNEKLREEYK